MKTILVPVELHDQVAATLQAAALLGTAFGSYLEGFPLHPALSPFLAADAMGATILYDAEFEEDEATLQKARQAFENKMHAHGIAEGGGTAGQAAYNWRDEAQGDNFVGSHSRLFDITVVGRPGTKDGQPRGTTLEAALFESGRPVLIAPPEELQKIGERILIAWNGSTETARTIGWAMPLLRRAQHVVVLTVKGSGVSGPSGKEVATYLDRHAIRAEVRSVEPGGRAAGKTTLDEVTNLGCDLLVRGAYTQSRLRQLIFGGTTRQIIAEAKVPVFMAH